MPEKRKIPDPAAAIALVSIAITGSVWNMSLTMIWKKEGANAVPLYRLGQGLRRIRYAGGS